MVTRVEEAMLVTEHEADVVVAQGAEAGGHRSTFELGPDGEGQLVGTMALVPQVVDAVNFPVVAAGGIADGLGLDHQKVGRAQATITDTQDHVPIILRVFPVISETTAEQSRVRPILKYYVEIVLN